MSMGATGEVALSERPSVLKQMRRLKLLVKDVKGEEYYETTWDGKPLRFYTGWARTLPLEIAKSLVGFGGNGGYGDGVNMPIQEECPQCKGKGFGSTGVCFHCKGKKLLDTGEVYHIFRLISQTDPTAFDGPDVLQRKIGELASVKEAAASLA